MSVPLLINCRRAVHGSNLKKLVDLQKRFLSNQEILKKRNAIFNAEAKRQRETIGRIEKIEVRYMGVPEDTTFMMNKGISTPYNVAQHLSEVHCNNSPVALVNNQIPWDMHRPLEDSCTVQLLNFKIKDPVIVNKAFWRTCSFLLGAVMQKTFKAEAELQLHSFPYPSVRSGSFIHDICLKEPNWEPTEQELRTLGAEMIKLASRDVKLERLEVPHEVALEMFRDNPFKREQLPSISNQNKGIVTLYRVEDHIDISRGPMVGSTRYLSRAHISSVHKLTEGICNLYRVQGVSLPIGFSMNAFAFSILTERAKKLNKICLPHEDFYHEAKADPLAQRNA